MATAKKGVILLSGGLDSATVLAIAQAEGFDMYALSFSYGQRHEIELEFAKKLAKKMQVSGHKIATIDLRLFGGSALTDDIEVPKDRDLETEEIPSTYVPARNTIFLSFALAYAETIGAHDIFIGANIVDYSGYPDCRPAYLSAFNDMANLATSSELPYHIHAPLIDMSKAEIIQKGLALGVDYDLTISCYDPAVDGTPCGHCDSCLHRAAGFAAMRE